MIYDSVSSIEYYSYMNSSQEIFDKAVFQRKVDFDFDGDLYKCFEKISKILGIKIRLDKRIYNSLLSIHVKDQNISDLIKCITRTISFDLDCRYFTWGELNNNVLNLVRESGDIKLKKKNKDFHLIMFLIYF